MLAGIVLSGGPAGRGAWLAEMPCQHGCPGVPNSPAGSAALPAWPPDGTVFPMAQFPDGTIARTWPN